MQGHNLNVLGLTNNIKLNNLNVLGIQESERSTQNIIWTFGSIGIKFLESQNSNLKFQN